MVTINILKEYGANTEEGLERCLQDEDFYLDLIPSALDKESYDALEAAVKAGGLDSAFDAAHALKGVLANLALTPIYEPASEMTELLRARTKTDYAPLMQKIWDERQRLIDMAGL